jgi:NAD(P)-dependent dehydrogenase (short-subunit alcohol dehydrogenase family)
MNQLQNKTVVITGAGSGMGKAMALLFASEGANVVATDLLEDRLTTIEKEIREKNGSVLVVKTNIAEEEEVKKMVSLAVDRFKTIDVLINNAGILDDFMPAGEATTQLWNKVLAVNLNGPFFACREVIPLMLKQSKGVIINVASIGGLFGSRAGAAYTTSKHGLIGLTKNIGFMYAQKGIRCNAIAPGGVNTNIGENMHPNQLGYEKLSLGMQSNPRMGEPSEIAEVALFLASDRSSFVNGAVITADGGWTAY